MKPPREQRSARENVAASKRQGNGSGARNEGRIPLDELPTSRLEADHFPAYRGSTVQPPENMQPPDVATLDTALLYSLVFPGPQGTIGIDGESRPYPDISATLQTMAGAKLASNTIVAILSRFLTYGVSLPLSIVTARILGPHDKGIYAVFLLIVLLFTYCSLGISSAGIYMVGKKHHTLRDVSGSLLGLGIAICVFVGTIYTVMSLLFPLPVVSELSIPLRILVSVLGPVTLLTLYVEDCLLAAQDIVSYNISAIVQVLVQAGGLVVFLVLYRNGLAAAALSYGLGTIISFIVSLVFLRKHTSLIPLWRPRLLLEMLKFGLKSYLTSLLNLGNLRLDTVLITLSVGVVSVGQYSVATSLSEITWQLPLVMATVLFPTAASASSASGAKIIARTCRRLLLILSFILIAIAIAAPTAINLLYGRSFAAALVPLWLLLPGALGLTVYKTLYSYLLGNGRPSIGILSTGVSLVATVVLDLLLIPRFGISGAAFTSTVAYCLNGLIVLISFVSVSKVNPIQVLVATPQDLVDIATQFRVQVRRGRARLQRLTRRVAVQRSESADVGTEVVLAFGIITGLWACAVLTGLNLLLVLLCMVGLLLALGFSHRLWLVVAILAADITLTDYNLPVPGSPSLRTVLGVALLFVLVLTLAQSRITITRALLTLSLLILGFAAIGSASNLINGGETSQFITHTLAGVAVMLFLATQIHSTRDLLLVIGSIAFVGVLSAICGILQVFFNIAVTIADPSVLQAFAGRAVGLTQNPLNLANDLVLVMAPLAAILAYVRLPWHVRVAGWVAVATLAVGTYVSGSRSGLIALAAVAVIIALGLRPRLRVVVLCLVLLSGIAVAIHFATGSSTTKSLATRSTRDTELSSAQRLVLWEAGLLIARDHPITGIGYDRFIAVSPQYKGRLSQQLEKQPLAVSALGKLPPHNDFLNMLVSFGPLGLLLFVSFHVYGAKMAWDVWRRGNNPWVRALAMGALAALAAYTVHEFVHNGYDDSLLLWATLGTIVAVQRLQAVEPKDVLAPVLKIVPVNVNRRWKSQARGRRMPTVNTGHETPHSTQAPHNTYA